MNTSQLAEIEVEIMHGCLKFMVHITTQIQGGGGGVVLGKLCNSILKCNMYYIRISPCCYYSTHGVVYTVNKVAYGEHHFTTSCAI